jgi:hypothetical protein
MYSECTFRAILNFHLNTLVTLESVSSLTMRTATIPKTNIQDISTHLCKRRTQRVYSIKLHFRKIKTILRIT